MRHSLVTGPHRQILPHHDSGDPDPIIGPGPFEVLVPLPSKDDNVFNLPGVIQ